MDPKKRKADMGAWQARRFQGNEKGEECKAQKEQGEGEVRITEQQTALSFRSRLQFGGALDKKQMNYCVYVGMKQRKKMTVFSSHVT